MLWWLGGDELWEGSLTCLPSWPIIHNIQVTSVVLIYIPRLLERPTFPICPGLCQIYHWNSHVLQYLSVLVKQKKLSCLCSYITLVFIVPHKQKYFYIYVFGNAEFHYRMLCSIWDAVIELKGWICRRLKRLQGIWNP